VTNLGYPLYPADRFGVIVDLMNMNEQAKEAYLTIYYDYVEGHPADFEEVKPVWLDAMQCGTSEVSGRAANAKFDFSSSPWIANFEGEVLGTGGHLHDGGTQVEIIVDKKVICTSVPTYGTDEEAMARANIAKAGGTATLAPSTSPKKVTRQAPPAKGPPQTPAAGGESGHSHMGGQHIIAMSICAENKGQVKDIPLSPLGIKELKKGQSWVLKACYDYTKFPAMKSQRGTPSTVMGISIMYAKTKNKRAAGAAGVAAPAGAAPAAPKPAAQRPAPAPKGQAKGQFVRF
jgi:hypothetical protein